MTYHQKWERLSDAVTRLTTSLGLSVEQARGGICHAVGDGTVAFRAKLGRHATRGYIYANMIHEGNDFQLPLVVKPGDFDWESSRPLKQWGLRREASRTHGSWYLDWIEVLITDVSNAFGIAVRETNLPNSPIQTRSSAKKSSPARERVLRVLEELYPDGVPEQAIEPNALLCRKVSDRLKEKRLPPVSDDTILRAAGRRK